MPKDTDDNKLTGTTETPSEGDTTSGGSETQPKPKDDKPSPKTFTEAQYKGLQAVIAKRDVTIAKLTNEKAELETQKAEAEANHGSAVTEKTNLSSKLTESTKEVANFKKQVAALNKKVKFQGIIMKDFPELAPVSTLIPEVETEEEFRAKAKEVQAALSNYVDKGVQDILKGGSPPLGSTNEDNTPLGENALDKAWDEATALAGITGKEAEYEKAYKKYQKLYNKANAN